MATSQVVKLKPADKDAQAKFKECDKVVKALRFAKAISQPDEDDVCVADSIDLSTMGTSLPSSAVHGADQLASCAVVEPSYSGARLGDDETVTLEFVKQMIQDFRDEKVLHRRCVAPSHGCVQERADADCARLPALRSSSCCV